MAKNSKKTIIKNFLNTNNGIIKNFFKPKDIIYGNCIKCNAEIALCVLKETNMICHKCLNREYPKNCFNPRKDIYKWYGKFNNLNKNY